MQVFNKPIIDAAVNIIYLQKGVFILSGRRLWRTRHIKIRNYGWLNELNITDVMKQVFRL